MPKKETTTKKKTTTAVKKTSENKTTKAAVKSTVKRPSRVKEEVVDEAIPQTNQTERKAIKVHKSTIIIAAIIIILGVGLYFGRGLLVAAVVNGQPISRLSVVSQTEKQSGKQVLDTQIRNTLIEQEAQKQHVTVTDKEINDELTNVENNLKKQNQNIDQVLAAQGMTQSDLRNLIRLDKLVGKLVGKDIKITDKQIDDYISKNQDILPKDQTQSQLRQTVKSQLNQQELNQKVQTWLANLQQKANIIKFVNY